MYNDKIISNWLKKHNSELQEIEWASWLTNYNSIGYLGDKMERSFQILKHPNQSDG